MANTIAVLLPVLEHLHNVEMHFHYPQTSLCLNVQCMDDTLESKWTYRD